MVPKKVSDLEKFRRKLKREKELQKNENYLTELFPEFKLCLGW